MNITQALKKAIETSGLSHASIERQTGVNRLTVARFMNGETTLLLNKADDLAAFFKIKITLPTKAKKVRK